MASYNQGGSAEVALHEIFQNSLSITTTNVSATMHARHPGVQGTGYVPYYLVFDHHGDLAYHHQGGPYHGGDGKAVLDRIRNMLKQVPKVYVGKEAYETHSKLAKSLASGKKLGRSLKELAEALESSPDDAELKRLVEAVERHARQELARFDRDVATQAKKAFKTLKSLARDFEGTPWGQELVERSAAFESREARKAHEAAAKQLGQVLAGWERLQTVKGNGGVVRNPTDRSFRTQNQAVIEKLTERLQKLVKEHGDLPAGQQAQRLLSVLTS